MYCRCGGVLSAWLCVVHVAQEWCAPKGQQATSPGQAKRRPGLVACWAFSPFLVYCLGRIAFGIRLWRIAFLAYALPERACQVLAYYLLAVHHIDAVAGLLHAAAAHVIYGGIAFGALHAGYAGFRAEVEEDALCGLRRY